MSATKKGNRFDLAIAQGAAEPPAARQFAAPPGAADRFAAAERILAEQPTGFTPALRTFSGESGVQQDQDVLIVPLDLIDDNPYNARRMYHPSRITSMAAAMRQAGQLQPGIAVHRQGRYVLVAGHYRLRGLRAAEIPAMRLTLKPDMSDHALFLMSYRENKQRNDQTVLDDALAWRDLLDGKVFNSDVELAVALDLSPAQISKTLSILDLSPESLEQIRSTPDSCGVTVLYEYKLLEAALLKLPDGRSRAFGILDRVLTGDMSRAEIIEYRKQLNTHKGRKQKENSRQHKLLFAGQSVGVLKDWDSGRVVLDITLTDPAERAKLLEELRTRFTPTA